MKTDRIIEERVLFRSGPLQLTGILSYPDCAEPQRRVLMCSPHPHFAGNMDNNVIREVAQVMAQNSLVLRFDYRGVGDSRIDLDPGVSAFDYWDELEQTKRYEDAVDDVAAAWECLTAFESGSIVSSAIVGYSFGTATACMFGCGHPEVDRIIGIAPPLGKVSFDYLASCEKPCLFVIGRDDFLFSEQRCEQFSSQLGPDSQTKIVDGCDHFFRESEGAVAELARHFICDTKTNGD